MSWGDPPAPPDPIRTAAAATATNVGTSVANAFLNNVNQITPEGKLNYDPTGSYSWNDPTTGQTYNIPTFTATQTLSPIMQNIRNQSMGAQTNLAGLANQQSGALKNLMGTPFNPSEGSFNAQSYLATYPDVAAAAAASGENPADFAARHYREFGQAEGRISGGQPAPAAGNPDWMAQNVGPAATTFGYAGQQQMGLGPYGQQQTGFGDAGDITRSYGPEDDFSSDRGRVEEALYGRLNPQLSRERENIEQRLADQGIRYGSEAYTRAMDDYSRQANDARLAVTQTAGQEQQRMMDMAAQRAGFQNAAQQQAYQQALGRGTFANQAQAQQFQEQLQAGTFANQAQKDWFQQEATRGEFANAGLAQQSSQWKDWFNQRNQARNQYMGEQYQQRNQPINEITALLSGSQVSGPSFVNTPQNNIATTDVASLINNRFSQDLDVYKQQSANFNSLMGGIFGMMGGMARGAGTLSDRREKEDIEKVGSIFAASPEGDKPLPIYEYSYKADPAGTRHTGPMAQDVEKIDKRAVMTRGGKKYIDTTRLGSILKVA